MLRCSSPVKRSRLLGHAKSAPCSLSDAMVQPSVSWNVTGRGLRVVSSNWISIVALSSGERWYVVTRPNSVL